MINDRHIITWHNATGTAAVAWVRKMYDDRRKKASYHTWWSVCFGWIWPPAADDNGWKISCLGVFKKERKYVSRELLLNRTYHIHGNRKRSRHGFVTKVVLIIRLNRNFGSNWGFVRVRVSICLRLYFWIAKEASRREMIPTSDPTGAEQQRQSVTRQLKIEDTPRRVTLPRGTGGCELR